MRKAIPFLSPIIFGLFGGLLVLSLERMIDGIYHEFYDYILKPSDFNHTA